MNSIPFLTNFMSIAHAPNGITRLREMILQLAVQGKLVPQDANDEPASVLLTKIQAEKERLIQAGTIKRPKPLPAIKDEEKPFALPKGWEWVRLGEVTNYGYTEKAEFDDVEENTWVLELEDVEKISSRLIEKGHDLKALKKRLSIQVPITLS